MVTLGLEVAPFMGVIVIIIIAILIIIFWYGGLWGLRALF